MPALGGALRRGTRSDAGADLCRRGCSSRGPPSSCWPTASCGWRSGVPRWGLFFTFACCFFPLFAWIIIAGPSDLVLPSRSTAISDAVAGKHHPRRSMEEDLRRSMYGGAAAWIILSLIALLAGAADGAVVLLFLGLLPLSIAMAWQRTPPTQRRLHPGGSRGH